MWSRAVWVEKESEEEAIIPTNWIKENNVYWPTVVDASKALKERREPGSKWRKFQLVKIKVASGKHDIFP